MRPDWDWEDDDYEPPSWEDYVERVDSEGYPVIGDDDDL